jgi:hypothetical protein
MSKRITAVVIAAFASLALLVPAGSAQAAWHRDSWCEYQTLKPGQSCTTWPLNVNAARTTWAVTKAGIGRVCVGVFQYGGSQSGQPVGGGAPGLNCAPLSWTGSTYADPNSYNGWGYSDWLIWRYNPYLRYSYRYGQAKIINYSSATIRTYTGDSMTIDHWQ